MKILNFVKQNYILLSVIILGAILRLYHLDYQSLWMDEIYTMNVSNPELTFKEFHNELILREGFPHLYFLIIKFFYFIFEYSSFTARLVSVLASILSIYLIYLLGKELKNEKIGLISALLLAVNEYNIYISQDARPYTLYVLFIIFSYYRLVLFLRENTLKNSIYYGLSVGLLLNINFFSLLNIFSQIIILLYFLTIYNKEARLNFLKKNIISCFIGLIMFIPNYQMLIKLLNFKSFWVPRPNEDTFKSIFSNFFGNNEIISFTLICLIIFYFINLFKNKDNSLKDSLKNDTFSFIILFSWFFIYFIILAYKSFGNISYAIARYFTSIIPVFYLLIAFSIDFIINKLIQKIVLISLILLTIGNLFFVKNYYNEINKSQFREVSNYVMKNNTMNDPIYTSQKYWFDYYFSKNSSNTIKEVELENLINEMKDDSTKIRPFWFVDGFQKEFKISENSLSFLNKNFYVKNKFDGFQAWTKHYILLKNAKSNINLDKYLPLKEINGNDFIYTFDIFEHNENNLKVMGWGYFENITSDDTEINVILIKDNNTILLPTQKMSRKDVTTGRKLEYNVDNCGFITEVDLKGYADGEYQIGVLLNNKKHNKFGFKIKGKIILL